MATVTFTLTQECASQNHGTITATGAVTQSVRVELNSFTEELTEEEKLGFLKTLFKIKRTEFSAATIRNALLNGYTFTL